MKKIYINCEDFEINIAITNNEKLINFFVEKKIYARVGNIYKGRVNKIIPNMNFIFIDINDEKPGFLSEKEYFNLPEMDFDIIANENLNENLFIPQREQITFEKGQELMVQVIKEAHHTKGARLSTNIMLPGNYIVFCPFSKNIGISKKIENTKERERLKNIVKEAMQDIGDDFGVIIRTNSQNRSDAEIINELKEFYDKWKKIVEDFNIKKAPALLFKECDIYKKILREYIDDEETEIIVDSEEIFNQIMGILKVYAEKKVILKSYDGVKPIFEYFKLKDQINSLYSNIISIKKGIYIKIDHTEALTVIDINSGKFKGDIDFEESIYLTNEIAAKEIARQIILRNIGGLIIIDFIDMKNPENKQKIKEIMDKELSKSKLFFKTSPISDFGLMEIIRKRIEKRIDEIYFVECEKCNGRGYVLSKESICFNFLKDIKYKCRTEITKEVIVFLPEDIKKEIENKYSDLVKKYEKLYNKRVILKTE